MFEVTVKFKTKEEMVAFFTDEPTTKPMDATPVVEEVKEEVKEEKKAPAKKKTAKKAAKKEEVKEVEVERVQEPATQVSPGQAAFNRDACLKNVGAKIAELQDSGMEGNDLANLIAGIFTDLGQPQCKISELDDSTLIEFSISFNKEVEAKKVAPASTGASFI
jgi:hypothetical protein